MVTGITFRPALSLHFPSVVQVRWIPCCDIQSNPKTPGNSAITNVWVKWARPNWSLKVLFPYVWMLDPLTAFKLTSCDGVTSACFTLLRGIIETAAPESTRNDILSLLHQTRGLRSFVVLDLVIFLASSCMPTLNSTRLLTMTI